MYDGGFVLGGFCPWGFVLVGGGGGVGLVVLSYALIYRCSNRMTVYANENETYKLNIPV